MVIFRGLALDEDRVGPHFEDAAHGENVRLHDVLQSRHESLVALQLLVPPAVGAGKERANEHFVDRRVELHPGKPLGERLGVVSKKIGKIRVLEIPDPVGNAEMAEVDDRNDVEVHQGGKCDVGKLPVIAPRADERPVQGRTVTKEMDIQFAQKLEILTPSLVVAALLHLINAPAAIVDGRDAVLDPGRKHER